MRSHVFYSSAEAYDASQVSDAVADGDVLLVPSEGLAAIMLAAWPTAVVVGEDGPGTFHILKADRSWQTVDDGKYAAAAGVAAALHTVQVMRDAGLGFVPIDGVLDVARSLGWTGEVPESERHTR